MQFHLVFLICILPPVSVHRPPGKPTHGYWYMLLNIGVGRQVANVDNWEVIYIVSCEVLGLESSNTVRPRQS